MYKILLALLLTSSFSYGATLQGSEKFGYIYPDMQAWKIVSVEKLATIPADLSGIPTILRGSHYIFGPNFYASPSLNSWGSYLLHPSCFKQEKDKIIAEFTDEEYLEQNVTSSFTTRGETISMDMDNMFRINMEKADISRIDKSLLDTLIKKANASQDNERYKVVCGVISSIEGNTGIDGEARNIVLKFIKPSKIIGRKYIYVLQQ